MNGLVDVDADSFNIFIHGDRTCENKCKLRPHFARSKSWARIFVNDVVDDWNKFTDKEILVPNVNQFKQSVHAYFVRVDL